MNAFPSNWDVVVAEDFCSSVRDGTHDSPKFIDHGHPLVTSKNIKGGKIDLSTAALVSIADFDEINRRSKVDQWDVLFSMIGTVGEVCLVETPAVEFAIKNVGLFKCSCEEDGRWLSTWLRSPAAKAYVAERLRGASQQYIPLGELRKFPVPVPKDKAEKRRITTALSTYDDLITANQRRITLLEDAARRLYREWFVHLRFPGHEQVAVKDGVPQGWEKQMLSAVANVNARSISAREKPDSVLYIDISSVSTGIINEVTAYAFVDAPGRARRRITHGDIIWSCVRPNRRSYALIWEPDENLVASTGFAVLSAVHVPFSYLYFTTTTDNFIGHLEKNATGAAYPAVTAKIFENAEITIPDNGTLFAFDSLVLPQLEQIETLKQQNRQLAQARDLLLPKLMSGQLDVTGIALPEEVTA